VRLYFTSKPASASASLRNGVAEARFVVLDAIAYGLTSIGFRTDGVSTPTTVAMMSNLYMARVPADAGMGAMLTCSFFQRITRLMLKPHTCGPAWRNRNEE
jgi:hypothetical protein